jgi:hypothetical protein
MQNYCLKLDVDGKLNEGLLTDRMKMLHKFHLMDNMKFQKAKTKHGWHIRISFNSTRQLNDRDIVFLQLFCLSDYKRELFNMFRVWNNCKHWNILFSGKVDSNNKLLSCEKKI